MLRSVWKVMIASGALAIAMLLALSSATTAHADDTEIYSATYQAGAKARPKVLIVFDDSGSMSEIVEGIRPAYDPNGTYVEKVPAGRIYWSDDGAVPDVDDVDAADGVIESRRWFNETANSCASSENPLAEQGKFAVHPLRWQNPVGGWYVPVCDQFVDGVCTNWRFGISERFWFGFPAAWVGLKNSKTAPLTNAPYSVDCSEDVQAGNSGNADGIGDGYPRAAASADTPNTEAYTTLASDSNVTWGAEGYTFFTSHYVNWYYDESIVPEDKDYLQIAQEVIEEVVMAQPGIDFGLAVYNNNEPSIPNTDGGRVIKRIIKDMTAADRDDLVDTLWGLDHEGNTPLCETAMEAYLYMSGGEPMFADSGDPRDVPLRDPEAESGGSYVSPLEQCGNTYIIFMTDGLPTSDTAANAAINAEIDVTDCRRTYTSIDPEFGDEVSFRSCLAPLTEYMADSDLNDTVEGEQNVKAATIGFNVNKRADDLLIDAATMTKPDGTPAYYDTESREDLIGSFNDIIEEILSTEQTLTSPAVAVDSFTRTQSRDDVFFAMFEPNSGADWFGNIKKFKLAVIEGDAVIVDADGNPALTSDGLIDADARSFWSAGADGGKVTAGGIGEVLQATALNTRNIRSNTGTGGDLETFSTSNVDAAAYGLDNAEALYSLWGVEDESDLANTIRWGWGYDVDDMDKDSDRDETRDWILADILHSTPLVINYGALGDGFTTAKPDLRIVVGTNHGLLHMFNNEDGAEDWAFFPKELGPVLTKRRKNIRNGENVYGVDAPAVVYTLDVERDGTLDHEADDKVYLYFGLRRGGNLYYALDISNPDAPAFLWSISPDQPGFGELGQSWSVPVITRIAGYRDGDGPKPVLVFAGGYDETKDDHSTLADSVPDTMGRGLFIVDAETGELVWSATPAPNSATNMQADGLVHSIAADVTPMDSNGDGLTDRIYLADTGGNVWRVDLPGNELPKSSQDKWFINHLFDANEGIPEDDSDPDTETETGHRGDRRFFNAPDVIRTVFDGVPVDAVAIGSGDRTNPIAADDPDDANNPTTDDQFYLIRDTRTTPYTTALDSSVCSEDPLPDLRCELPLEPEDLYDITSNDIQSENEGKRDAAIDALKIANGWRLDLVDNGEKVLSRSLTIAGRLYFTTFTPAPIQEACTFTPGNGRLYVIDLLTGGAVIDFDGDGEVERWADIGNLPADTPSTHFGEDGTIRMLFPPDDRGDGSIGNPFDTGASLPGPYGSYWNRGEY